MPSLVTFFFQINFQVGLRPNHFAIEQTKSVFTQRGVQQVQHGGDSHDKFVFGGGLISIFTFFKERLLFDSSIHVPNSKRKRTNQTRHGGKELLLGIVQFRGRRRRRNAIGVDQMFTDGGYGALRFKQKFQFGRPPQRKSIEQGHDLQIIQQDFLNGRRQSLFTGIVDRVPHQKSQPANQNDKPQRHQTPIVALVFGAFRATVGALSFEGGRARVAEAGRVAES
jgi:hypothetical protein